MRTWLLHGHERETAAWARRLGMAGIGGGDRLPQAGGLRAAVAWGRWPEGTEAAADGLWVLNGREAVRRARNAELVRQYLSVNGIPCLPEEQLPDSYCYRFQVPVFHLEALGAWEQPANAVYRSVPGAPLSALRFAAEWREVPAERRNKLIRQAMRSAERAVYALGLDFALVAVAGRSGGDAAIVRIDPVPIPEGTIGEAFAEAIRRFDEALGPAAESLAGNAPPPLLGADPEFVLRRPDGRVVPASRFFPKAGRVGCDAVILPGRRVIFPLVELRPAPAREPRELTRQLVLTMRQAARRIPDASLEWLSGGMPVKGLPLGGHIHFGGMWLNARLLRALDNYLSLPLALIEAETTRRRRPKFGFLGDAKRKSHGGFEYRTPPSWLVSPGIARGVLALAQLIAVRYPRLGQNPLRDLRVQQAYYYGDKPSLAAPAMGIWEELLGGELPERCRADLRALDRSIREGRAWDESRDFRGAWNISPAAVGRESSKPLETVPAINRQSPSVL